MWIQYVKVDLVQTEHDDDAAKPQRWRAKSRPARARRLTTTPGALDRVPLAAAVRLLAGRLPHGTGDDTRAVEDRVRQRISAAVKRGVLKKSGEQFIFGALIGWARSIPEWQPWLAGLPAIERAGVTLAVGSTLSALGKIVPAVEGAHERLAAALEEIERLKAEIERLRPDAERYLESRAKNKASAARKRGERRQTG